MGHPLDGGMVCTQCKFSPQVVVTQFLVCPFPVSDASIWKMKGKEKSGAWSTGWVVSAVFKLWKALSVSSVRKLSQGAFFYQVCKRASHIRKIRDEASVISCQPQEGTHLCFGAGLRETLDHTYFFFLGQHQTSPDAETMYRASVRPMWNLWGLA